MPGPLTQQKKMRRGTKKCRGLKRIFSFLGPKPLQLFALKQPTQLFLLITLCGINATNCVQTEPKRGRGTNRHFSLIEETLQRAGRRINKTFGKALEPHLIQSLRSTNDSWLPLHSRQFLSDEELCDYGSK